MFHLQFPKLASSLKCRDREDSDRETMSYSCHCTSCDLCDGVPRMQVCARSL